MDAAATDFGADTCGSRLSGNNNSNAAGCSGCDGGVPMGIRIADGDNSGAVAGCQERILTVTIIIGEEHKPEIRSYGVAVLALGIAHNRQQHKEK